MTRPVADLLDQTWRAFDDLCADLDDADWDLMTECPGWTVRDNVSHVIGTERGLIGDAAPTFEGDMPGHVKNPIGALNEAWVDARRGLSGAEVLAELRETFDRRRVQLAELTDDEWDREVPGPTGMAPYTEFMNIRVMDTWVHEQDIRRAVGRPGHTSGPVAEHSIGRFVPAMGFVVGKKAGATEGQSVRFDLVGPLVRSFGVVVDGRARVVDAPPAEPTATIEMDAETWWCLALGRWEPDQVLQEGKVSITGDRDLAERVVRGLAFMI